MPTTFCRHIKTNGRRCCSPALRTRAFCYFHEKSHARLKSVRPPTGEEIDTIIHSKQLDRGQLQREPLLAQYWGITPNGPLIFDFPALDDPESIQSSLSMLILALGQNRIDAKRAAPILYGLQVASQNVSRLTTYTQTQVVRETTIDETGTEIALDEDPIEIIQSRETQAAIEREEAEEEAQRRRDEGDYDEDYEEENANENENEDKNEIPNDAQDPEQPQGPVQPSISQLRSFLLK